MASCSHRTCVGSVVRAPCSPTASAGASPHSGAAHGSGAFVQIARFLRALVANAPALARVFWPVLALFALFAAFVAANGGVVLGALRHRKRGNPPDAYRPCTQGTRRATNPPSTAPSSSTCPCPLPLFAIPSACGRRFATVLAASLPAHEAACSLIRPTAAAASRRRIALLGGAYVVAAAVCYFVVRTSTYAIPNPLAPAPSCPHRSRSLAPRLACCTRSFWRTTATLPSTLPAMSCAPPHSLASSSSPSTPQPCWQCCPRQVRLRVV